MTDADRIINILTSKGKTFIVDATHAFPSGLIFNYFVILSKVNSLTVITDINLMPSSGAYPSDSLEVGFVGFGKFSNCTGLTSGSILFGLYDNYNG